MPAGLGYKMSAGLGYKMPAGLAMDLSHINSSVGEHSFSRTAVPGISGQFQPEQTENNQIEPVQTGLSNVSDMLTKFESKRAKAMARARRYRQNVKKDPVRYNEFKRKNAEKKRRERNKKKDVVDPDRLKHQRELSRERSNRYRAKKKQAQAELSTNTA